jgi:carbon monoxide dehydrogenase subunit G
MQVSQSQVFPYPRDAVWEKLMDFDVLGRTLPGVETLVPVDELTCNLTVKVLVPSITGRYEGSVQVVEKQPIDAYKLRGEAKGRLGWVKGDADFELHEEGTGTEVRSTMNFQTGGVLSGVGQRFMQAIAKSMIREFFKSFDQELAGASGATVR